MACLRIPKSKESDAKKAQPTAWRMTCSKRPHSAQAGCWLKWACDKLMMTEQRSSLAGVAVGLFVKAGHAGAHHGHPLIA